MTEAPKCDSWYEDDESFGIGHECKLPKGHEGCGHHQNLYEAAVERYEQAEAAIARVRGIVDADQTVPIDARDPASYVAGYADATFRVRQVLDGGQR